MGEGRCERDGGGGEVREGRWRRGSERERREGG